MLNVNDHIIYIVVGRKSAKSSHRGNGKRLKFSRKTRVRRFERDVHEIRKRVRATLKLEASLQTGYRTTGRMEALRKDHLRCSQSSQEYPRMLDARCKN